MAKVTQKQAAGDLVERARLGDQNAMATIQAVGEAARRPGNETARTAYQHIVAYMSANPAPPRFGAEDSPSMGVVRAAGSNPPHVVASVLQSLPTRGDPEVIGAVVVMLSLACPWDVGRVAAYDSLYQGIANAAFRYGLAESGQPAQLAHAAGVTPELVGVLCVGHCVGSARRIQVARVPRAPLSVLGPAVGWEAGCCR